MTQIVTFHLPAAWLGPDGDGMMPFYEHLRSGLEDIGRRVAFAPLDRGRLLDQVESDTALHLVNHGRFRHPRVLNAGVAYIYPFWNVDPWGIRAFSSIAAAKFAPATIDAETAQTFFRRLRRRLVGRRASRYPQDEARATGLPPNAVAVFLQSEAHRDVDETCHLTRTAMVETVLATWPGPVIVKPHPRDPTKETRTWLNALAAKHANLTVSRANIHDILSACDRVVTINSAVGVEAYLHRKPVILCGQADFHHIAVTARAQSDLEQALMAPMRRRAYDKFIYWYFAEHCLSATEPNLAQRFLSRYPAGAGGPEDDALSSLK